MTIIKLTQKLSEYISKVERETGRQTVVEYSDDLGISGMPAAFTPHPSKILILIKRGAQMSATLSERLISHEATHGLLIYGRGYCYPVPKRPQTYAEYNSVNIMNSMIDDIVVNKIIHEEGFPPFAPEYLRIVEEEIKAARKRKYDFYNTLVNIPSHETILRDRLMVLRYIAAWSYINYLDLEPLTKRIIRKFLKSFEKSFISQAEMASRIKEVISQNDIFTAVGHNRIIEIVLKLWHLEDLAELKTE